MQNFDFSEVHDADRKDIVELADRIEAFNNGQEDEEKFRLYRLTRGVYGQRQLGVQMFRTKIPFGKITAHQLLALADISDKYATGNLHLTTRQNIQMHYVKLKDSPAVWTALAQNGLTAREACGNTVRNITASAKAGIDPEELFDVSPYVQASFEYFLRNPICQEMGRKIKPAFSSSDKDSAFTYFHDFGFIPRIKAGQRGFKMVVGGGLGAVPFIAHPVTDFIPTDQIIPFMEAALRVFDRYGEREKRMKARMKFLVKKMGIEQFLALVEAEKQALATQSVPIDAESWPEAVVPPLIDLNEVTPNDPAKYQQWLDTNVFEQKQSGYYGVQVKVPLGDIHSSIARPFAELVKIYAADDIRITVNQGLLVRFVRKAYLPHLFNALDLLKLAEPGFDSTADITACPGTDTCALGVTNSTGLATQLEEVIQNEYPALLHEKNIKIKISGCMNACGQHMAANIGFHGSSIKKENKVIPAMQVVIGGGVDPHGKGHVADKVIKLPTKRIPEALRVILEDFDDNNPDSLYFNDYYQTRGKRFYYDLLKPLAEISTLEATDFFDWGQDSQYIQEIGVGECAGVTLDVVGTIIKEASNKTELAQEALTEKLFAESIYHSYTAFVIGAKALLLSKDVRCNTHQGIIEDFQEHYIKTQEIEGITDFPQLVLQMKKEAPTASFAENYFNASRTFMQSVIRQRRVQLEHNNGLDKLVIESHYKA